MLGRFRQWVTSIRDSFVTLLPLTFIAVICVLVRDFPLDLYQRAMVEAFGAGWQASISILIDAVYGLFGIALCLIVAVDLGKWIAAKRTRSPGLPSVYLALSALVNFMACVVMFRSQTSLGLGKTASFAGFVVGVISAEMLYALLRLRFVARLSLPYDTDSAFYHALRLVLPIMLSCGLMLLGCWCLENVFLYLGRPNVVPWFEQPPLADGMALMTATVINQAIWFVGLHGGYALDALSGSLLALPHGAGASGPGWRLLFDNFVLLGGSGATLGLLLAIHIAVKEGPIKHIGRLSWIPGVFNINETVLYGLPVLLNRIFLLPFLCVPVLLAAMAMLAVDAGWLQVGAVQMPWTTPIFISGWLLSGSWAGVVFQAFALGVSTVCYLPFVRIADRQRMLRQHAAFARATEAILENGGDARTPVCARRDGIGLIARGLLSDLRESLRTGGLSVAYQPKHHIDGRLIGFEALLRWQHPKYGALSPAIAIALAEENGDIGALGLWVLNEACACKARINQLGRHSTSLAMSINVSPLQLDDGKIVAALYAALERHGLLPCEVELEITESQRLIESAGVSSTLEALAASGVRLAIDDFGMGYASLRYLKRFSVGAIKIDGSLTRDVLNDPACADIVRVIASLGQTRNVMIVGEWVETPEQKMKLAELGCQCFQGYLFSPPLPEPEAIGYIEAHRAAWADTA
jgi:lactose/cellobiose-specific phosphotransferase system IIC component